MPPVFGGPAASVATWEIAAEKGGGDTPANMELLHGDLVGNPSARERVQVITPVEWGQGWLRRVSH